MEMLPTIIETIVNFIMENLPVIIQSGIDTLMALINGIVEAIPLLIDMLPTIIDTIVTVLLDNLPLIIQAGFELLTGIINGLLDAIPDLIEMVPQIIITIVTTLVKNLPKILEIGATILLELIKGIGKMIGKLALKILEINLKIQQKFTEGFKKIGEIGKNLVEGLWNGILSAGDWLANKVRSFATGIIDNIKSALGIKSPSTVMRDMVGKNMALGLGEGFSDEMKAVSEEMQSAIPTSFDTRVNLNGSRSVGSTSGYAFDEMVSAFKEALYQVKIEMDDEEMGRFVDKTVTRLVYT